MAPLYRRSLLWTPRVLAMLYIAFLSMFALDVFGEQHGFWPILAALSIHLIPSFILAGVLILAWRWEWVGAAVYTTAGAMYAAFVMTRPLALGTKISWIATIAAPIFLVAALFLAAWLKHDELHARHREHRS